MVFCAVIISASVDFLPLGIVGRSGYLHFSTSCPDADSARSDSAKQVVATEKLKIKAKNSVSDRICYPIN